MEWVFVNDKFVAREDATVSVFDHGFLYGDGVFETLRAYGGRIFQCARHLERLRRSCALIGLVLPEPEPDWRELTMETLARNGLSDAWIRVTVSRGEGALGLASGLCPRPTIVIMAGPARGYPDEFVRQGVTLALADTRRNPVEAQPPEIKSLSFLNNVLAKQEAERAGAFDALMVNVRGELTECTVSNVMFVRAATLHTPASECGVLHGVTREVVMELARDQGVTVAEGAYMLEDLFRADECFLTNTSMEIMPVAMVGAHRLPDPCPGPMTTMLRECFQRHRGRFLDCP